MRLEKGQGWRQADKVPHVSVNSSQMWHAFPELIMQRIVTLCLALSRNGLPLLFYSSCIVVVASTRLNMSIIDLQAHCIVSFSAPSTIGVLLTTFFNIYCNPAIISGA